MDMVNFEWGGVESLKKVAVSTAIPVECLLGSDLETSAWSGMERKTHAAMPDLPEWVCVWPQRPKQHFRGVRVAWSLE